MSPLFTPIRLGPMELPNRIAVAPMCQYSADDGSATDWHLQHLMQLAMSAAGLVTVEATAVERRGRITHGCLGLYSDANEHALARALAAARRVAAPGTKFGIQIAHAGRKASTRRPWEGGGPLPAADDPWPTVAPSAVPFAEGWHVPAALDAAGIERTVADFVAAAERAVRIGFDAVELHMAHGYLLHEFFSPASNRRDDQWGGTPEKRMALLFRVAEAVAAALPPTVALGARITGTEWTADGTRPDEAAALARGLKARGVHFVYVSSGGNIASAQVPVGPGYQVHLARAVKEGAGVATRAVGMIVAPRQAEAVIAEGHADLVALARPFLDNPRWVWHAAEELGAEIERVPQYARAGELAKRFRIRGGGLRLFEGT